MFGWLASQPPTLQHPSDRYFLQQLPLYPALDKTLRSLDCLAVPGAGQQPGAGPMPAVATCDESALEATVGGPAALPRDILERLLEYKPEWLLLYSRLQVRGPQ